MAKVEKTNKMYNTNYSVAVNWLNGSLILANMAPELDENGEFWDNLFNFNIFEEDANGESILPDFYQYYLTSYSRDECRFLSDHFGLIFSYCEKLDLWVLCVDHYGTSWDYVSCLTDIEAAARELGERK